MEKGELFYCITLRLALKVDWELPMSFRVLSRLAPIAHQTTRRRAFAFPPLAVNPVEQETPSPAFLSQRRHASDSAMAGSAAKPGAQFNHFQLPAFTQHVIDVMQKQ